MSNKILEHIWIEYPVLDLAALKAVNITLTGNGVDVEVLSMSSSRGKFVWNSLSIEAPDDINIVVPDSITPPDPGRWERSDFALKITSNGKIDRSVLPDLFNTIPAVIDFYDPTAALPVTPTLGDRYISLATANGWTINNVYEWNNTIWVETIVFEIVLCVVTASHILYIYDNFTWEPMAGTSVWYDDGGGTIKTIATPRIVEVTAADPSTWLDQQFKIKGTATSGGAGSGSGIAFWGHDGAVERPWGNLTFVKANDTPGDKLARAVIDVSNTAGVQTPGLQITPIGSYAPVAFYSAAFKIQSGSFVNILSTAGLSADVAIEFPGASGSVPLLELTNTYTQIQSYNAHPSFTVDTEIIDKKYADDADAKKEPVIVAGATSQYWRGDKSWQTHDLDSLSDTAIATPLVDESLVYNGAEWVNKNVSSIATGLGVQFYLDDTIIIADGTDNDNEVVTASKIPISTAEQIDIIVCNNNTILDECYFYDIALERTSIDAGEWLFNTYCAVSSVIAARVSSILINVARVRPEVATVTIAGSGTSRTATASGDTPFATTKIDVGGTIDSDSYLMTPNGLYRITARTNDTVVTITTPTTYVNESAVSLDVWKRLFQQDTGTIATVNATGDPAGSFGLIENRSVQSAFVIEVADKLGAMYFGVSNNATNVFFTHNGTERYSNFRSTLTELHNDFPGLQGGSASERFHITQNSYDNLALKNATNLWTGVSNTFNNKVDHFADVNIVDSSWLSFSSNVGTPAFQIVAFPYPSSTRQYFLKDMGADADFVFTAGAQSFTGVKTFSGNDTGLYKQLFYNASAAVDEKYYGIKTNNDGTCDFFILNDAKDASGLVNRIARTGMAVDSQIIAGADISISGNLHIGGPGSDTTQRWRESGNVVIGKVDASLAPATTNFVFNGSVSSSRNNQTGNYNPGVLTTDGCVNFTSVGSAYTYTIPTADIQTGTDVLPRYIWVTDGGGGAGTDNFTIAVQSGNAFGDTAVNTDYGAVLVELSGGNAVCRRFK